MPRLELELLLDGALLELDEPLLELDGRPWELLLDGRPLLDDEHGGCEGGPPPGPHGAGAQGAGHGGKGG
jgi:hypothetical protein